MINQSHNHVEAGSLGLLIYDCKESPGLPINLRTQHDLKIACILRMSNGVFAVTGFYLNSPENLKQNQKR